MWERIFFQLIKDHLEKSTTVKKIVSQKQFKN